jgi:hypothetical protein
MRSRNTSPVSPPRGFTVVYRIGKSTAVPDPARSWRLNAPTDLDASLFAEAVAAYEADALAGVIAWRCRCGRDTVRLTLIIEGAKIGVAV